MELVDHLPRRAIVATQITSAKEPFIRILSFQVVTEPQGTHGDVVYIPYLLYMVYQSTGSDSLLRKRNDRNRTSLKERPTRNTSFTSHTSNGSVQFVSYIMISVNKIITYHDIRQLFIDVGCILPSYNINKTSVNKNICFLLTQLCHHIRVLYGFIILQQFIINKLRCLHCWDDIFILSNTHRHLLNMHMLQG